jgi:hypothetical protein
MLVFVKEKINLFFFHWFLNRPKRQKLKFFQLYLTGQAAKRPNGQTVKKNYCGIVSSAKRPMGQLDNRPKRH